MGGQLNFKDFKGFIKFNWGGGWAGGGGLDQYTIQRAYRQIIHKGLSYIGVAVTAGQEIQPSVGRLALAPSYQALALRLGLSKSYTVNPQPKPVTLTKSSMTQSPKP